MGKDPCILPPTTPYRVMSAHHLRTVRDRFAPKSPHESTLFYPIPCRIEGDMGWGSTPTPSLPLPPHIGKCSRTPGAWCGIGSTRNRVPNAIYFVRIREDLRELGRVQVPPPAPPRCTCQIGSARPPEGARFRRRRARASGRPWEVPGSARKRWEGGKMR